MTFAIAGRSGHVWTCGNGSDYRAIANFGRAFPFPRRRMSVAMEGICVSTGPHVTRSTSFDSLSLH